MALAHTILHVDPLVPNKTSGQAEVSIHSTLQRLRLNGRSVGLRFSERPVCPHLPSVHTLLRFLGTANGLTLSCSALLDSRLKLKNLTGELGTDRCELERIVRVVGRPDGGRTQTMNQVHGIELADQAHEQ